MIASRREAAGIGASLGESWGLPPTAAEEARLVVIRMTKSVKELEDKLKEARKACDEANRRVLEVRMIGTVYHLLYDRKSSIVSTF